MAKIELTPELIETLKNATDVESLKAVLSQNGGASLTDDEAKALFEKVKDPKGWPLNDDDLDMVAGGIALLHPVSEVHTIF